MLGIKPGLLEVISSGWSWEVDGGSRLGSRDLIISPQRIWGGGVIQIKLNNNKFGNLSSPKTQRTEDSS